MPRLKTFTWPAPTHCGHCLAHVHRTPTGETLDARPGMIGPYQPNGQLLTREQILARYTGLPLHVCPEGKPAPNGQEALFT